MLPYTKAEIARLPRESVIDALGDRTYEWVMNELEPISRRTGLAETSDYLTGGMTAWAPSATADPIITFSWFYRCPHFDAETRQCLDYDNRPEACRGYPWSTERPETVWDLQKALPPECSYRADLGQPVAVALTRRPDRPT